MGKYPVLPESGAAVSMEKHGLDIFIGVEKSELYRFALSVESKIVRVSPELFTDLVEFNNRKFSRRNPNRRFEPQLSSYKKATKYKGKDNEYIKELDRVKYIGELCLNASPDEKIIDTVLVISKKANRRVLGIGYKVLKGNDEYVRCFIRYSTLTEKRTKAEIVIHEISRRLGNIFDTHK